MDSFYILIFMVLLLVFYCFVVKSVEGISPTDGSKPKKFKSFKEAEIYCLKNKGKCQGFYYNPKKHPGLYWMSSTIHPITDYIKSGKGKKVRKKDPNTYSFLYDGCPKLGVRGAKGEWTKVPYKMVQRDTTFEQCKKICSNNPKCNIIEIAGCGNRRGDHPSKCSKNCFNFYGGGTRVPKNGGAGSANYRVAGGCRINGKMKAYKKNSPTKYLSGPDGVRGNIVTYKGRQYRTLVGMDPNKQCCSCETVGQANQQGWAVIGGRRVKTPTYGWRIPLGWKLAPFDKRSWEVVKKYRWNTALMALGDGPDSETLSFWTGIWQAKQGGGPGRLYFSHGTKHRGNRARWDSWEKIKKVGLATIKVKGGGKYNPRSQRGAGTGRWSKMGWWARNTRIIGGKKYYSCGHCNCGILIMRGDATPKRKPVKNAGTGFAAGKASSEGWFSHIVNKKDPAYKGFVRKKYPCSRKVMSGGWGQPYKLKAMTPNHAKSCKPCVTACRKNKTCKGVVCGKSGKKYNCTYYSRPCLRKKKGFENVDQNYPTGHEDCTSMGKGHKYCNYDRIGGKIPEDKGWKYYKGLLPNWWWGGHWNPKTGKQWGKHCKGTHKHAWNYNSKLAKYTPGAQCWVYNVQMPMRYKHLWGSDTNAQKAARAKKYCAKLNSAKPNSCNVIAQHNARGPTAARRYRQGRYRDIFTFYPGFSMPPYYRGQKCNHKKKGYKHYHSKKTEPNRQKDFACNLTSVWNPGLGDTWVYEGGQNKDPPKKKIIPPKAKGAKIVKLKIKNTTRRPGNPEKFLMRNPANALGVSVFDWRQPPKCLQRKYGGRCMQIKWEKIPAADGRGYLYKNVGGSRQCITVAKERGQIGLNAGGLRPCQKTNRFQKFIPRKYGGKNVFWNPELDCCLTANDGRPTCSTRCRPGRTAKVSDVFEWKEIPYVKHPTLEGFQGRNQAGSKISTYTSPKIALGRNKTTNMFGAI